MADRRFSQDGAALEKGVVTLFLVATFGATGAPTLVAARSKGVASIARSSTGKYVITLQDKYQRLLGFSHAFVLGSGFPAAPIAHVVSDAVATTPAVTVQFSAPSGASGALQATDPANGEEIRITLELSNSTAI